METVQEQSPGRLSEDLGKKLKAQFIGTPTVKFNKIIHPPQPKDFVPNFHTLQQATVFRIKAQAAARTAAHSTSVAPSRSQHGLNLPSRGLPAKKLTRRTRRLTLDSMSLQEELRFKVPGSEFDAESDGRSTRVSLSSAAWEFNENYNFDDSEEEEAPQPKNPLDEYTMEQRTYHFACKLLNQIPASGILNCLESSEMHCRYRVLGEGGAQALAEVLRNNLTIKRLDLCGNNIGSLGTGHICAMLRINSCISHLTLSENNLNSDGLLHVVYLMKGNIQIKYLDISGNHFKDDDATMLADMLQDNIFLVELNLSWNSLCEKGGILLAPGIAQNDSLKRLDLSWNHLRRKGAMALADAIRVNTGLTRVNLSWNGFHLDGCKAIRDMLTGNRTLTDLDLSSNRIEKECLRELTKGLCKNETLQTLKLLHNPMTTEGAIQLVDGILRVPTITIKEIDISGQTVDDEFLRKRDTLMKTRSIDIKHGLIMAVEMKVAEPDDGMVFVHDNPLVVLMEYMRILNLRPVDLFTSLDKDGSWSISREEFREGLMRANIPLSMDGVNFLITKLDADGDGEVDFGELIAGTKEHKSQVLRYTANNPEVPFVETDVGRVNIKLQAIMTYRQMVARVHTEKDRGAVEDLSETMDELRQKLAISSTGQESLDLVKRANAKFRAIMNLRKAVSGKLKVLNAMSNKGLFAKREGGEGGVPGSRPLTGLTVPLVNSTPRSARASPRGTPRASPRATPRASPI